ncbi:putative nucleic acid-binding protein, contains PIN domain [Geoglobus ahangari]|uniref:Putative nucleic acid-binding protein, contains PIN domain n=1 Tax=Geoglobus ahangari TaxID=113653 RepID=A0A0F7ID08_9EURY|nr:DUF3368 domain-containing protein [Geoglobus ahangari]AKG90784.1 putative nucleic acid-binding protein, contains PIN domain [Geoglobus ahangari]
MIVVSNTSPLVVLSNIGELDLLKFLFERIIIPRGVAEEFGEVTPEWIEVRDVQNRIVVDLLKEKLHTGEAEAIALAVELKADLMIIDDKSARNTASSLGLRVIGTVGLILLGKKRGYYAEIKPVVNNLLKKGFRLSKEVVEQILKDAGEL